MKKIIIILIVIFILTSCFNYNKEKQAKNKFEIYDKIIGKKNKGCSNETKTYNCEKTMEILNTFESHDGKKYAIIISKYESNDNDLLMEGENLNLINLTDKKNELVYYGYGDLKSSITKWDLFKKDLKQNTINYNLINNENEYNKEIIYSLLDGLIKFIMKANNIKMGTHLLHGGVVGTKGVDEGKKYGVDSYKLSNYQIYQNSKNIEQFNKQK